MGQSIYITHIICDNIDIMCEYWRLLKIRPWAMNLSGFSKRGVGVFSRTLSPKNRPTPFEGRPILFESRPTQVLKNPDITDL